MIVLPRQIWPRFIVFICATDKLPQFAARPVLSQLELEKTKELAPLRIDFA